MEGTGLVGEGDKVTSVNQEPESWSKLEPGVCDIILEKLPSLELLRLRVVCKDWNCSALKKVECKPYFVIIVKSTISWEYLSGLVVYNVVSNSLSFEHSPFKLHDSYSKLKIVPFAVEGLILSNHPKAMNPRDLPVVFSTDMEYVVQEEWCVFNIHTGTTHVLPRPRGSGSRYFCGMMVDTSVTPHTFKLVVSYSTGKETQLYDSRSRSWSLHPKSNPNSNSSLLLAYKHYWYFCMCHKGCMYMSNEKAEDGVLVYSMEEDQWSKLSGSPFRGEKRTFLGAWDDRIFAVLHDAGARSVTVWELVDVAQQEWVEYARCSKVQYEQLMEHDEFVGRCKCEIMSVFSEEYVLMYNWHGGRSYALVILNLKTREWVPVASIPNMIKEDVYWGTGSGRPCIMEEDDDDDDDSICGFPLEW